MVFLLEDADTTSEIANTKGSVSILFRVDERITFVIRRRLHPGDVTDRRNDDEAAGDASTRTENGVKKDSASVISRSRLAKNLILYLCGDPPMDVFIRRICEAKDCCDQQFVLTYDDHITTIRYAR